MATTAPGMDGKEVIGVCREMVSYLKGKNRELKEYALAHPFAGDAKEILYFKYYKPALTGRLLYYYRVYQIESGCPACLRVAEPYYRKAMERAERMMERYLPFYQYYHSGATYRDSYYFLRAKGELSPESGSFVLDEEAEFSTGYDILAARLISVEMLLVHLSRRMERAAQGTETEAVPETVELAVYDNEGMKGLCIETSLEREAAKEAMANIGGGLGTSISFARSAGQQVAMDITRGLMQGGSQYLAKKFRTVKVHLKAGDPLMLYAKQQ